MKRGEQLLLQAAAADCGQAAAEAAQAADTRAPPAFQLWGHRAACVPAAQQQHCAGSMPPLLLPCFSPAFETRTSHHHPAPPLLSFPPHPLRAPAPQVKSTKMNRTIVVRRDYLHFIKKYQRYEKRHTNISAHISPCFRCHEGDSVVIGQCRCAGGRAGRRARVGQGPRAKQGEVLWRGRAGADPCATPPPFPLCRPLSKTVRFNVLRVVPAGSGSKKAFGAF